MSKRKTAPFQGRNSSGAPHFFTFFLSIGRELKQTRPASDPAIRRAIPPSGKLHIMQEN